LNQLAICGSSGDIEMATHTDHAGDVEDHKEGHEGRDRVTVHVVHVNETERASFKEKETATLQHVWDHAYEELHIERKPKDVFQTGGKHPVSLMSHLGLTLEQARKQKVITDYHFGIASETGGA
jgi:hypothetical protein